jgi:hypothetical protein
MIGGLIAGERDPAVLADLARGLMRKKIPDLTRALAGRFAEHHGLLAGLHLAHIDDLNVMIGRLEVSIAAAVTPSVRQRDGLSSVIINVIINNVTKAAVIGKVRLGKRVTGRTCRVGDGGRPDRSLKPAQRRRRLPPQRHFAIGGSTWVTTSLSDQSRCPSNGSA